MTDKQFEEMAIEILEDYSSSYSRVDIETLAKYIRTKTEAKIVRLEKLLDDKCDRCIERDRNNITSELFEFIKKELRGVVGSNYLDYLERKYKKQKGVRNER